MRSHDDKSSSSTDVTGLLTDIVGVLGVILIGVGCWFIYRPAAALVPGVLLCVISICATFRQSPKSE